MAAGSIPKKSLTAAEKELTRKRLELAIKRLETQEDKVSQNKRTRLIEIKEGPDDNLEQAEDLMEGIQFDNDSGTESNPLPADGNGNNPPPADNNGNNQPPANSNGNNPPPADNNGNNPPPADNNGNNQPPANGNGNNPPPVNGTGNNPPNGTGNSPPPADDPKGGEKHHIFKSIEDEEELFVAQDHQETKSTSYVHPELGEALYTFPDPGKTSEEGVRVETVAWAKPRGRPLFINRFIVKNMKSVARYRLCGFSFPEEYELNPPPQANVSDQTNRLGDQRVAGNKYKFRRRDVLAILGVAWPGRDSDNPSRDDLDLLNPEYIPKGYEKKKWAEVPTYILIAWKTGDITWETRTMLRTRLESPSKADKLIYECALDAENKHEKAMTGKLVAHSRSPSISDGLAQEDVNRILREASFQPSRARSSTPPQSAKILTGPKVSESTTDALAEALQNFRIDFCEGAGVSSFEELSPRDKRDFVVAWRYEKASLLGAAT